jgi:YHS domain-containing protein
MKRLILFFALLLLSTQVLSAEPYLNTVGSDDKTAISGFDTVAFFTEKKAFLGRAEFEHTYRGVKWRFSSKENLKLFQENPEKFMPEWGGHCAWAVSEVGGISPKKLSGSFEIIDGKLYLFSFGNRAADSARDSFLYGRWSASNRILDGNRNWPELKKKLEEGLVIQPNSSSYRKSGFE